MQEMTEFLSQYKEPMPEWLKKLDPNDYEEPNLEEVLNSRVAFYPACYSDGKGMRRRVTGFGDNKKVFVGDVLHTKDFYGILVRLASHEPHRASPEGSALILRGEEL